MNDFDFFFYYYNYFVELEPFWEALDLIFISKH